MGLLSFRSWIRGSGFRFRKRIVVTTRRLPGRYKCTHHRAEHWIVVHGTAMVTIGEDVKCLYENEFIYVPSGARHRLENPGKIVT